MTPARDPKQGFLKNPGCSVLAGGVLAGAMEGGCGGKRWREAQEGGYGGRLEAPRGTQEAPRRHPGGAQGTREAGGSLGGKMC